MNNMQKNYVKGAVMKVAVMAASFLTMTLLVESCAGKRSTETGSFLPPKTVQSQPHSQQKSAQQEKTSYFRSEAILKEKSVTLTDRQGKEHTVDLSAKMKELQISSLIGGRLNQVDTKDGGTVCNVYLPNSSAPIMILISPSGEERVISGPPVSR